MSDTTQTAGHSGAGEDEYTPTGTDQVAERLAALDDDAAELRAASLRAGLADYELDADDAALLSGEFDHAAFDGPVKSAPDLAATRRPTRGPTPPEHRSPAPPAAPASPPPSPPARQKSRPVRIGLGLLGGRTGNE